MKMKSLFSFGTTKSRALSRGQKGFTLIELVIVLVILGVLAAVVVPRYVDLTTDAEAAAKAGISGSAKSSFAIYIAENKTLPTVTQLAGTLSGATAVAGGLQVDINGTNHTVPTYTDDTCATATTAVGDTVRCVGNIPQTFFAVIASVNAKNIKAPDKGAFFMVIL